MAQRYGRDHDSMAAAIFAVTFVILGGLGICSAVAFTFNPKPFFSFLVIGGSFLLIIMVILRIVFGKTENSAANRSSHWIVGKGEMEAGEDYVPELQRQKGGSQTPPSVDKIRSLKDGTNNWVPSGSSSKPKKR